MHAHQDGHAREGRDAASALGDRGRERAAASALGRLRVLPHTPSHPADKGSECC